MNQKARITYRFDTPTAKTPVLVKQEELKVRPHVREDLQFIEEIAPWNSPFQDDNYALEKLIRSSEPPSGAEQQQQADEQAKPEALPEQLPPARMPEIILGDDKYDGNGWYGALPAASGKYIGHTKKRSPTGPSWLKVFASIAGAVATGALFGYLVLSLFTGQELGSDNSAFDPSVAAPVTAAEGNAAPGGEQSNAGSSPSTTTGVAVDLPPLTFYLLQYGVFNSSEGAAAATAELKSLGAAAASAAAEDYRVFAGIASNKTEATAISKQLPDAAVYVKAVEIPALQNANFAGQPEQLQSFVSLTAALLREWNALTLAQLELASPQKLTSGESETWQNLHQQWVQAASSLESGLAEAGMEEYVQLVRAINTVAVSLGEYNKHPSRAHIWSAQSALMEAFLAHKAWREQIVAL